MAKITAGGHPPPGLLYVDQFAAHEASEAFEYAKRLELEGLVANRVGSTYQPGVRPEDW